MKRISFAMGAAVLLAASCAGGASAGPAVHKASGGGTVDWPGGRVTYGFNAQVDAAGAAKGEAEFQFRDVGVKLHVEIDCLTVAGNDAWLSGTIRTSDDASLVGQEILWRVEDNGEGPAAPSDRTSTVVLGVARGACATMPTLGMVPWTNGNVQVR